MHTKTHVHAWHCPHAEALIPRPTIYAQTCLHQFIVIPCRWPQRPCPKQCYISTIFPPFFLQRGRWATAEHPLEAEEKKKGGQSRVGGCAPTNNGEDSVVQAAGPPQTEPVFRVDHHCYWHMVHRPSNSLCKHSMRAAEKWKALILFCAKSLVERSGVSEWHLIRSCATLAFSWTSSLMALMSPYSVPQ